MAVAYRGGYNDGGAASPTSGTWSLTGTNAVAGDFAICVWYSRGSTKTVTPTGPTLITGQDKATVNGGHLWVGYKVVTATDITNGNVGTWTANSVSNATTGSIVAVFSGVDTSVGVSSYGTMTAGGSSDPNPPSTNTTAGDCLVAIFGEMDQNDGVTAPTNFTIATGWSTTSGTDGSSSVAYDLDGGTGSAVDPAVFTTTTDAYWTTTTLNIRADSAPTVALGTPSNGATISDTTPALTFTGTDVDGDLVDYNLQIDTENSFTNPITIDVYSKNQTGFSAGASHPTASGVEQTYTLQPAGINVADTFSESNANNYFTVIGLSGYSSARGQSFTGNGGVLNSVKFYLKKTGLPVGSCYAKIYNITGTSGTDAVPTGSALATSDAFVTNSLGTSPALATFTFSGGNKITLSDGTNYIVTFEYSGTDTSACPWVGIDTSLAHYDNGNSCDYSYSGASWSNSSNTYIPFYVYTDKADETLSAGTYYWRVRGIDPSGSNTYGAWSDIRNFTIASGTPGNSERSLWINGRATSNSERNLYEVGKLTNNSERGLYLAGKTSSERNLYITGKLSSNSERGLYVKGKLTGNSERNLYVSGKTTNNSIRNLYTTGKTASNSERGLYTTGKLSNTSERNLYISGKNTGNLTRNLYLSGKGTDSSTRGLYAEGLDQHKRYWVGGTGNWDSTAHWAIESGGTGGQPIPTMADDVYIDSNSGISGGTITINASANVKSFVSTVGSAYTVTKTFNYAMYIYGSLILENTINFAPQFVSFYGTDAGKVINTNGATLNTPSGIYFYSNGEWTLENDLVTTGEFQQDNGTFYGNGYNVTAKDFYFESYGDGNPWGLHMGSGTWTATIQGWYLNDWDSTMSFNCDTSTVKLLSSADYGDVNDFAGGGKTYNKLWWTGNANNDYKVSGSNTFNEFKIDTPPHVVRFESGTTQTVNIFSVSGTAGNLITLDTLTGAGTFTLSKASGVVGCDYLDISRSTATGGASWYAGSNSVNNTTNTGWLFENPPLTGTSERSLYATGKMSNNSERNLWQVGKLSSYSERNLYLAGKQSSSLDRLLYLTGKSTNNSVRGLYVTAKNTSTSNRGLYITGKSVSSSTRNLYEVGKLNDNSIRNLYLSGKASDNSSRSLYIEGYSTLPTDSSERGLYLEGVASTSNKTMKVFINGQWYDCPIMIFISGTWQYVTKLKYYNGIQWVEL